jgi:hypothetical protein
VEVCDHKQRLTIFHFSSITEKHGWTHWRRVELPPLPVETPPQPEARQASQEERDDEALVSWDDKIYRPSPGPTDLQSKAWHAALAHERRYLGMPAERFVKELNSILANNTDQITDNLYRKIALLAKAPTKP